MPFLTPRLFAPLFIAAFAFFILAYAHTVASEPKIRVTGIDGELQENVKLWLSKLNDDCELSPLRERGLLKQAKQDTEKALQALGYYQADINLHIKHSADCWQLQVDVLANAPVTIKLLDIQLIGDASDDESFAELIAQHPLKENLVLRHDLYESLRDQLQNLARERGYFDANLSRQLLIDPSTQSANIHLHLHSGARYYFGEVTFEQQALRQKFLHKFIRFKQGEPFDNRRLLGLRQVLAGSGYFNDVRVEALVKQAENYQVPIRVSSELAPRYVYIAGVGFATDTGARIRAGVENRRVNRFGHRYITGFELSQIRSDIGFNYEIPIADPNRERVNLGAGASQENINGKLSDRYRLRTAYLREWRSGWIATHFLDWEKERFKVADQRDSSRLLMPGYELTRIKGNDPLYPTFGWKLNGMMRFAHQDLTSTASFVQFHGLAKLVLPTWYGRILTRVEGGATLADELAQLPSSVRFFAGGDSSIRGYAYQSLGPKNAQGKVTGGRHMLTASLEYEFPFSQKWYGAVFTDAGNAYDKLADFKAAYGVGMGIRWRSPIGPIRLDIAHPNQGTDRFRIHISMGLDL